MSTTSDIIEKNSNKVDVIISGSKQTGIQINN